MKYPVVFLSILTSLVLAVAMRDPPDGGSPILSTWPDCQSTLSCSFDTIQKLSLDTRLTYLRSMQSKFFDGAFHCGSQFRAIEGVIEFFQSKKLGAPGTWVSYTDAGIIEAIQRGGAIALGISSDTGGNPGSTLWANFMKDMAAGKLNDRDKHDYAWSVAEQTSTDYGKSKGDAAAPAPSTQVKRWFQFTQIFRAMMRNRTVIIAIIDTIGESIPGLPFGISFVADEFFSWFTDITQIVPTLCGSDSSWTLAALDVPPLTPESVLKDKVLLLEILPKFIICWVKNIF